MDDHPKDHEDRCGVMAVGALPIGAAVMAAVWMMTSWRGEDKAWLRGLIARGVDEAKREGSQMLTAIRLLAGRFAGGSREEVALGDIAEMVDVVRLGLSAGLSFDAALELYCTHRTGVLPDRMMRARLSWQMGIAARGEELERAARDVGERSLESFGIAVDQALKLGSPLSETLAAQSREIRSAHRAQIERDIERAPVKLLIPTGTLILPALLLSIVGPLLAASGML